jgi:hypothetical protein
MSLDLVKRGDWGTRIKHEFECDRISVESADARQPKLQQMGDDRCSP